MRELFNSPTFGIMTIPQVVGHINDFIDQRPSESYRLVIGSDSQPKNSKRYDFVVALVIHRIGNGGIYFWKRIIKERRFVLRDRIYEEACLSLKLAQRLIDYFPVNRMKEVELEIHVDIGNNGETRAMISEVVGMIRGSGFAVKTKPYAFGAACVADRYA